MKSKIKILHVQWEGNMGGLPKFVYELVNVQKDDPELEVAVCYAREGGPFYQKVCSLGIPVYTLGLKNGYSISSINKFFKFLKSETFDIIHIHNVSTAFFIGSYLAHLKTHLNLIYVDHGILVGRWRASVKNEILHRLYNRPLLRWFCNHLFNRCIVNSKFTESSLLNLGVAPHKIIQIYHGIKWDDVVVSRSKEQIRGQLKIDPSEFVIGTVSRLAPYKRVERFIKVAHLLQSLPQLKFVIIGDGAEYHNLKRLTKSYSLNDRVKFLGKQTDVYDLISAFDLFVFTSTGEAWPRTTVEALLLQVPVLAFEDGGGVTEIVEHGDNGFILRNEQETAEVIKGLINDKNKLEQLKISCSQKLDKFDIVNFAKNVKEKIYRKIIHA